MLTFFCYCALENTAILWSSSYLALHRGIPAERAAAYASLFFIGITAGRAASGFLTIRFSDCQMIRMGQGIIAAGAALVLLPMGERAALGGLLLVGLGCAPIYPCVIHSTPFHFGADKSQAIIGVQMASAYVGTCLMPTLFGVVASRLTIALFPVYLLGLLALMAAGGLGGGILGRKLNRRMDGRAVERLFMALMAGIICVSVFNAWRYAGG